MQTNDIPLRPAPPSLEAALAEPAPANPDGPPRSQGSESTSTPHSSIGSAGPGEPGRNRLPPKRRGEVAEAAFLHKAASLGFSVAKPWGDSDRYDFILENGARLWRVQIKSANVRARKGEYTFFAHGSDPGLSYTAQEIDFLIGYIVPENTWFVFPIQLFATRQSVTVVGPNPGHTSRYEKYREAWCLLACPQEGSYKEGLAIQPRCQHGPVRDTAACPKVDKALRSKNNRSGLPSQRRKNQPSPG